MKKHVRKFFYWYLCPTGKRVPAIITRIEAAKLVVKTYKIYIYSA
jgi:hypothetical protein